MIERIILSLLIAGLSWAAYRGLLARLLGRDPGTPAGFKLGHPAILYFSSPDCAPCKTLQSPTIRKVCSEYGERLQLLEVDVTQHPDVAKKWGVVTLPTTYILDQNGQPKEINLGIARAEKIRSQVEHILS